ncbi:hypothetical protein [Pseudanabaena cinerea]|jgi:hypothetical protein|uniref:hypothetical protein n=1 Tax=Pseudanabaena cinerea TaxID=2661616 RepID=UPI001F550323|nr:hypothetical protein [Pseudanabaena cinerea]
MFNHAKFPISVGVANIRHYQQQMQHFPKYLTQASEFGGFQELVMKLIQSVP